MVCTAKSVNTNSKLQKTTTATVKLIKSKIPKYGFVIKTTALPIVVVIINLFFLIEDIFVVCPDLYLIAHITQAVDSLATISQHFKKRY